ncbi:MAG: hypothetical protein L0215_22780 [Gemmataceae bacterium]|nr:hypothetical protein [Gemmataceae bacterium]
MHRISDKAFLCRFGGLRQSALCLLLFGGAIVGGWQWHANSTTRPSYSAESVKSAKLWRDKAIVIPPAGGLTGTISRQELYRALLFVQPQWRVSKTSIILHALRLWGPEAQFDASVLPNPFYAGIPSGKRMLEVILDMEEHVQAGVKPSAFLYRSEHGVRVWYGAMFGGDVAHVDQFLKVTGELGLSSDQEIRLMDGSRATLGEVVHDSLALFSPKEELEFTAVAYSRWLPPNGEWVDRFGNRHSLDDICLALARKPLGEGTCSGIHVPYALVNLLRAHYLHPVLSKEAVQFAETRLQEISRLLEKNQSPSGAWFENWHVSNTPKDGPDPTFQIISATGHHLEWIALAPERLRPATPCVKRSARLLAELIPRHTVNTISSGYTAFSHAARALALIEECDPAEVIRTGPTKVAPDGQGDGAARQ